VTDDIYCKHDGSLDDGVEIVTHPATIDYHCNQLEWSALISIARSYDFTSHSCGTCGLHVHVSRMGLGYDDNHRDLTIAKIMLFFERNWDNIVKFSRRSNYALEHWAKRVALNYTDADTEDDLIEKSKAFDCDRYTAINLTNRKTVEFRIFRGTLKKTTLLASIQFVDVLVNKCKDTSLNDFHSLTWDAVFSDTPYKELNDYIQSRIITTEDI
jgi:hypothetical protein